MTGIHVQRSVQLGQTLTLCLQLFLLGEGLFNFRFRGFHLLQQVLQLVVCGVNPPGNGVQGVFHADQVAPGIRAQLYGVRHGSPQGEQHAVSKGIKGQRHPQGPVGSQFHILILRALAGFQNRLACGVPVRQ